MVAHALSRPLKLQPPRLEVAASLSWTKYVLTLLRQHRYCTLYKGTAHYTQVLHTIHRYCTLYTGTAQYKKVLHTIHRYYTLYTGTAH